MSVVRGLAINSRVGLEELAILPDAGTDLAVSDAVKGAKEDGIVFGIDGILALKVDIDAATRGWRAGLKCIPVLPNFWTEECTEAVVETMPGAKMCGALGIGVATAGFRAVIHATAAAPLGTCELYVAWTAGWVK